MLKKIKGLGEQIRIKRIQTSLTQRELVQLWKNG